MTEVPSFEFLAALVTPFTRGGREVDLKWVERLVEKLMLTGGLTGLWLNGTTGEWHALNVSERKSILEACVEHSRARLKIYQGVQSQRFTDALELAKHARDAGADAIFTLPPPFHKPKPETLERYLRELNKVFDGPIFIYINTHVNGNIPEPETIARLASEGIVHGSKLTVYDLSYMERLVMALENEIGNQFDLLAGSETLLPSLLPLGARGAVSALANLAPLLPSKIATALNEGKMSEAVILIRTSLEARRALSNSTGFIPAIKKALQLICRRFPPYVRPPALLETRVSGVRRTISILEEHLIRC